MTTQKSNAIPVYFQAITAFITCALLIFLTKNFMDKFCPPDKKPQLKEIDFNQVKPDHLIKTGMHIDDFTEFDPINNKLTFTGMIWFKFDPKVVSSQNIDAFSFALGKIEEKHIISKTEQDGLVTAVYKVTASFR